MNEDPPRRPFEVRAHYCGGAGEPSASVQAHTPEEAAALAVWRGHLPMWYEGDHAGNARVYCNLEAQPPLHWPQPTGVYALSPDHSCTGLAFGRYRRTLMVEAGGPP